MVRLFSVLLISLILLMTAACSSLTVIKEPSYTDKVTNEKKHNVNVHSVSNNLLAPSMDRTRGYLCDGPSDASVFVTHGGDPGDIGTCTEGAFPIDHAGKGALDAVSGVATAGGLAYGLSKSGDTSEISNDSGSSSTAKSRARSNSISRNNGNRGHH